MNRLAISAVVLFLSTAGTALAAPVYWTPTHMVAALTALQYPQSGAVTCHGIAKARHGTFAAFRCRTGATAVYAKPLAAGRVCASPTSLASCKTVASLGKLTGDPRRCSGTPVECAENNAQLAARRHVGGPGGLWQGPSFACTPAGTLRYTCPMATTVPTVYTVVYTRGQAAWIVTVTP